MVVPQTNVHCIGWKWVYLLVFFWTQANCLVYVLLVIFIIKHVERLMAPFSVSKMCEHAPVALGSFEEGINTQLLLLIIVEN